MRHRFLGNIYQVKRSGPVGDAKSRGVKVVATGNDSTANESADVGERKTRGCHHFPLTLIMYFRLSLQNRQRLLRVSLQPEPPYLTYFPPRQSSSQNHFDRSLVADIPFRKRHFSCVFIT